MSSESSSADADADADDEEMEYNDDDKESTTTSHGATPKKLTHDQLFTYIKGKVEEMKRNKVKYDARMYSDALTPESNDILKMYLMTVGPPRSKNKKPDATFQIKKKTLTAYVGCSASSTYMRIIRHNVPGPTHTNKRTKNGAPRWTLCMVLYIPNELRNHISLKMVKHFWDTAHGSGKIKLGLFLHRQLGIPCYITDEAREAVTEQIQKLKATPTNRQLFKPATMSDVNNKMYF